jgi:hypothetical protein
MKEKQASKIKVLSPLQVAKIIGASPRWTYRHLADHTIPCVRLDGKIFVEESALARFLAGGGNFKTEDASRNKAVPTHKETTDDNNH